MWNEIKAEIIQLIANQAFTKNFALVSLVAIAIIYSLADLQSKHLSTAEPARSSDKMILKYR